MKKIILCAAICFLLMGCAGVSNGVRVVNDVKPKIVVCGNISTPDFSYLVDKNTGVVYLWAHDGYNAGLSVMLNADGSVVTAEQLGIALE